MGEALTILKELRDRIRAGFEAPVGNMLPDWADVLKFLGAAIGKLEQDQYAGAMSTHVLRAADGESLAMMIAMSVDSGWHFVQLAGGPDGWMAVMER